MAITPQVGLHRMLLGRADGPAASPPGVTVFTRPKVRTHSELLDAVRQAGLVPLGVSPGTTVRSTVTGAALVSVPTSSAADTLRAVRRARRARDIWCAKPLPSRAARLVRLRAALAEHREALVDLILHASGLGSTDATEDCWQADRTLRRTAAKFRTACAPWRRRPRTSGGHIDTGSRGTPAVVGTFIDGSWPLAATLESAVRALLQGSTVVSAVDTRTAPTALVVLALARECGLPASVWQLVVHDDDAGCTQVRSTLIEHVDEMSSACCRPQLSSALAGRWSLPGLFVLRHDGNSRAAARAAARSCFSRAGRSCAATPLVMVHATQAADFIGHFVQAALSYKTVAMLPRVQSDRLMIWLDNSIREGDYSPLL
ncbi:aldehyde dehydrogenase family protein, partial [Streptomyces klenkii]|uniref:aldehyde dehydrogenase family protein n=1 Tax=Streptomyces klenkii TaxID=1420899 RepID=UPI0033BE40D2